MPNNLFYVQLKASSIEKVSNGISDEHAESDIIYHVLVRSVSIIRNPYKICIDLEN